MIFKAFILELPKEGDNIYKVRIPYMEDNTSNTMEFEALLCNQPGNYGGYKIGDCVWVSFENNRMIKAIILGKLYVDIDENIPNYQVTNELNITGHVTLPDDTTIGGYGVKDFKALWNKPSGEAQSNLPLEVRSNLPSPYAGESLLCIIYEE